MALIHQMKWWRKISFVNSRLDIAFTLIDTLSSNLQPLLTGIQKIIEIREYKNHQSMFYFIVDRENATQFTVCSSFMFNKRLNIHQFYSVNEPLLASSIMGISFQQFFNFQRLRCFVCFWFIHNMFGFLFPSSFNTHGKSKNG